jgi:hypothetical protein
MLPRGKKTGIPYYASVEESNMKKLLLALPIAALLL